MKRVNLISKFALVAIFAIFSISFSTINAQTFKVDSQSSKLKWHATKVLGEHYGHVLIDNGWVKQDGDNFTGEFWIDMTSITCDDLTDPAINAKLIGHLKSDDFFSVNNHKMSSLKIVKIAKKEYKDNNYVVVGDLTIKGITKQISFPVKIDFKNNTMTARAEFEINRTWWDIKYGSGNFFDGLGDSMINDNIQFTLNLVSKK